jgi:maleate isomerase
MSAAPVRLGVIVPSSNTSLEPLTQSIIADISTPQRPVSVHFARIRMTHLSLTEEGAAQFALEAFIGAAQLLIDAKVNTIHSYPLVIL